MIAVKQSTLTCKIQDFPSSRLDTVVVVYSYDCLLLYLCAVVWGGVMFYRRNGKKVKRYTVEPSFGYKSMLLYRFKGG